MERVYVPGYGASSAKILICAEAPGGEEERIGRPLVGPTGRMVDQLLEDNGAHRNECYATNVYKYRPPGNSIKDIPYEEIAKGLPQLYDEVDTIRPNVILAFGNLALYHMTGHHGITKWRGSYLPSRPIKGKIYQVIPTIHPASLFKDKDKGGLPWQALAYIRSDVGKAVQKSKQSAYMPTTRLLHICRSYSQLFLFLQRHKDKTKVAVDIEVINAIPVCVGLAFSKYEAMTVPLGNFGSWTLPGQGIAMHELVLIWRLLAEFFKKPGLQIIGQNFKFDHTSLWQICGFKIPDESVWCDTQLLAQEIHPEFPKSLQFLTTIYSDEPFYKDEGKEFNPKKDKIEDFFKYNGKDCCVEYEIAGEMLEVARELGVEQRFFEQSMPMHGLYREIDRVGFKTNEDTRKFLWTKYETMLEQAQDELDTLAGYAINCMSPKQVGMYLFHDLKLPFRASVDEDTLVALLGNHAKTDKQRKSIPLILAIRRIRKTLSTYLACPPDFDGRTRTVYRLTGAETGRTSTSQPGPPVRPIMWVKKREKNGKIKLAKKKIGMAFHTMTKHGDIGADLLTMFEPDGPDECIGEADQSQAEARIVANLAGDEQLLKLFDTIDIHRQTATWLFGIPYEKIDKKNPMRFVGKTTRHAGNYDMGKHRLMTLLNTDALRFHINIPIISEYKANEILETFHKFSPKIRGVFHEGIKQALRDKGMTLVNSFGRTRQFFGRWDHDTWKEAYAQIPQSTVADQQRGAMLRIKKRLPWLRIVLEWHDSMVWLCKISEMPEIAAIVKEEMERPIDFERCTIQRPPLVIPCEVKWSTENFKSLIDYKVA